MRAKDTLSTEEDNLVTYDEIYSLVMKSQEISAKQNKSNGKYANAIKKSKLNNSNRN